MSDTRQATIRDYLRMLRASRVTIVALVVLCAAAAAGFSLGQTPMYVAEAQLSFQEENQSNAEAGVVAAVVQTPAQLAARGAESVLSTEVLRLARRRLGPSADIEDLRKLVTTNIESSSNLVTVRAQTTDASFASRLANQVAQGTVSIQTRDVRRRFAVLADRVQRELRELQREDGRDDAVLAASFFSRIASLRTLSVNATPVRLAQQASEPQTPSSPKPLRNTFFGGFIGLLLGVVVAFVRSALDRRLRSPEEIQDALELPILGSIRTEAFGHAPYLQNGSAPMSEEDVESFRMLRASLDLLNVERPPRSILVTSPLPQEGKSTVAASLALAMTAGGAKALLVECDLRRPCLAGRLDLQTGPGLVDYLGDGVPLADVVQSTSLGRASSNGGAGATAGGLATAGTKETSGAGLAEKLSVVTAGSRSIAPAELLGTQRFRVFMYEATQAYDVVVIDTPPLLAVADTMKIAALVEGLLLCIRSEQTTREQARAAGKLLARLPERPTGVVITGVQPGQESDYGYYSYTYSDEP